MATPKPARTPAAGGRPGGKSRDKGTRGGRPEPQPVPASGRRPRNGQRAAAGTSGAANSGAANSGAANSGARAGNGQQRAQQRGGGSPAARQGGKQAPATRGAAAARGAAVLPPEGPRIAPTWFQWTTWVLSLAGLGVSTYLTIAHFTSSSILACSDKGLVNCAAVTTSAESMVFGIFPVAVLGLAFYVFMAAATSPWAWRITWPPLRLIRVGSVGVGMVFVLYLIYTELFTLNAICLWCTSVHVITFLLFALIVFSLAAGYGTTQPTQRR